MRSQPRDDVREGQEHRRSAHNLPPSPWPSSVLLYNGPPTRRAPSTARAENVAPVDDDPRAEARGRRAEVDRDRRARDAAASPRGVSRPAAPVPAARDDGVAGARAAHVQRAHPAQDSARRVTATRDPSCSVAVTAPGAPSSGTSPSRARRARRRSSGPDRRRREAILHPRAQAVGRDGAAHAQVRERAGYARRPAVAPTPHGARTSSSGAGRRAGAVLGAQRPTRNPNAFIPVPPMFAATSWWASKSRARSSPP